MKHRAPEPEAALSPFVLWFWFSYVNFTKKKKNARLLFVNLTFFGLFSSLVQFFSDLVVDVAAMITHIAARTFFTSAVAVFISVIHPVERFGVKVFV